MTGTMSTRRQANHAHSRSTGRLPALTLGSMRAAWWRPWVEATEPVERERLFDCEHFRLWRPERTIAVYRRRLGCAERAGVHRGRGPGGTRRGRLCHRKRRRISLAGGPRSVYFSAVECGECIGNRDTGVIARVQRMKNALKKLIVFDLDGTLAESKSSLDAEMSRLLNDLLVLSK